ncbi:MAG: pyridoxal-phosphate dependent enzyme, partial [Gammaproteobacteria bacterium]|nr:pyridoxal-phosphate dependent enzyme [Gammaproteobacteria bacterium]
ARHRDLINEMLSISSSEAVDEMRRLARQHGLFCGPSSGAHLLAAKRVCEQYPEIKTVVTLFCDKGEKYLNEYFMQPEPKPVTPAHFT